MLDVLPALRAALPGPDLFYQETVHLTPRGHAVVAEALERFIEDQPVASALSRVRPRRMVFNSLHFVWFFLVVYAAYRALPHRAQNWLLLVASYYFYAAWDWRFLGLLIASTLVDYSCARALARASSAGRAARAPHRQPRVQPDAARVLQVLQLLRRQPARRLRRARVATSTSSRCASCCRSASPSTRS